jgi:pimeloyl-ACP methyl ester carboxylesterase
VARGAVGCGWIGLGGGGVLRVVGVRGLGRRSRSVCSRAGDPPLLGLDRGGGLRDDGGCFLEWLGISELHVSGYARSAGTPRIRLLAGRERRREDDAMTLVPRVVFLPGASGDGEFWRGVGERLPTSWEKVYVRWPGLGAEPADPSIGGFEDLVAMVADGLDRPSDLVAQSIGGVVAVGVAARVPRMVRRLVLVATSGGVDVAGMGAEDWRAEYRRAFPDAAAWVADRPPDVTEQLGRLASPTLLLWGAADPISPVAVGEHLARVIPGGVLRVLEGGTHDFGRVQANLVAPLIEAHLRE